MLSPSSDALCWSSYYSVYYVLDAAVFILPLLCCCRGQPPPPPPPAFPSPCCLSASLFPSLSVVGLLPPCCSPEHSCVPNVQLEATLREEEEGEEPAAFIPATAAHGGGVGWEADNDIVASRETGYSSRKALRVVGLQDIVLVYIDPVFNQSPTFTTRTRTYPSLSYPSLSPLPS